MDNFLLRGLLSSPQPEPQNHLRGMLYQPPQQNALLPFPSGTGLAPYGIRHSGLGAKGKGFFGMLATPSGDFSTEISAETGIGEFPLLVPTLTRQEIDHLLSGKSPTDNIYMKAEDFARQRIQKGLSPFAMPNELRYPLPK